MSAISKIIIIGALATTVTAWFLHGPFGLGEHCAAASRVATAPPLTIGTGGDDGFNTEAASPAAEEPASAQAAAARQAQVAGRQ